MELLKLLQDPPREFTAMPFWFLNGDLDEDELCRQLRDFKAHGIDGVVLHPRMGLPDRIPYLSETFFHYIEAAVGEAAALGMRVVLYDEGMYPSGSACGQVVADNPDFASRGIALAAAPEPGDTLLAATPKGVLVARKSGGTLRGVHEGEDDGEPNAPPSADILNPAAVDTFIRLTHEQYYAHLKPYFGSTVIAFFTDEPSILGRNTEGLFPWSLGLEEIFTAAGGKLTGLAALFAPGEENADTALYHRLVLQREGEVYYKKLSDWCAAHGIALMGHPHQSDDIEVERYFQIPGQDLVLRWLAPEKDSLAGMDSAMAKCSADAAHLAGRRRNANECFGACNKNDNPWQLSGGDVKWYLDWLAVRGVNLFVPHAFYYSIAGKRRDERPPDVGPNSIWWGHYRLLSGYMRRLSCLMTDAEIHTPVAVLCKNRALLPEQVRPLYEGQIGFRYLPESAWDRCSEQDGSLVCGNDRFTAVIGAAAQFPGVPHFPAATPERDCLFTPRQPGIRTARFTRAGSECWLLTNEGEETIRCRLVLPTDQQLGCYDLWNNTCCRAPAYGVKKGMALALTLPRRASVLFFACAKADYAALPAPQKPYTLPLPVFTPEKDDPAAVQKTYTATLKVTPEQAAHDTAFLELNAEEMAEIYLDGELAGVGFWPSQRIDLKPLLKPGQKQSLRVVVTGSPANRYGREPVPYGLRAARRKNDEM